MTGSIWGIAQDQDAKQRKWPKERLLGFAPGNYMCKCLTCGSGFIGDKRSVMCGECAMTMHAEGTKTTHFSFTLCSTSTQAVLFFGKYDALVRNIVQALWLYRRADYVYTINILYENIEPELLGCVRMSIMSDAGTEASLVISVTPKSDVAVLEYDVTEVKGTVKYINNGAMREDTFNVGYGAAVAALTEMFKGI